MKIYIAYKKRKGPWGGGNQFLSLLENEFKKSANFSNNIKDSDVVLINSFTDIGLIINVLIRGGKRPIIHRLDGPVLKYRSDKISGLLDDLIVFYISKFLSDASIFQSYYSLENSFLKKNKDICNQIVIGNTAKESFFNVKIEKFKLNNQKLKIVSSSWSKNKNKGLDYLIKLDKDLDFDKYDFTFIGNIDYKFFNIKHIQALPNDEIPNLLKKHHLYYSASKFECCSNAICEALAVGLPCIAHYSGGNKELIKKGGILFKNYYESFDAIDQIYNNYSFFKSAISLSKPKEVANKYYEYMKEIYEKYNFKKVFIFKRFFGLIVILIYIFFKRSYVLIKKISSY